MNTNTGDILQCDTYFRNLFMLFCHINFYVRIQFMHENIHHNIIGGEDIYFIIAVLINIIKALIVFIKHFMRSNNCHWFIRQP